MSSRPWIIPVGGFLGAGKTSLILAASRILHERGLRAAAILNDQGFHLVDTAFATAQGLSAGEVTGACFCCRFSDLVSTADRLRSLHPAVIFIEPVGSCTDLAATLLRPLQQDFLDRYRVAPLTVVVDPEQARHIELGLADANIKYLFGQQLAEADLVVYSKSDLEGPLLPDTRRISAITGSGIAAWLDEVLSGNIPAGTADLTVDYREYAAAEAALGWLNWSAHVACQPPLSAAELLGPMLDHLQSSIVEAGGSIAHLKMLAQTGSSYLKVALTGNESEPIMEGDLTASPAPSHDVRLNVRAVLAPDKLERFFRQALASVPGTRSSEHFQCFSPGEPRPERRIPAPSTSHCTSP